MAKKIFLVALSAVCTVVSGWILYLYWGWFMVPVTGYTLSYKHAIGIDLTIGLELSGVIYMVVNSKEKLLDIYVGFLLMMLLQLAIGFIWHLILR